MMKLTKWMDARTVSAYNDAPSGLPVCTKSTYLFPLVSLRPFLPYPRRPPRYPQRCFLLSFPPFSQPSLFFSLLSSPQPTQPLHLPSPRPVQSKHKYVSLQTTNPTTLMSVSDYRKPCTSPLLFPSLSLLLPTFSQNRNDWGDKKLIGQQQLY